MIQNLLYCPISKTALTQTSKTQLDVFNELIQSGQVYYRNGDQLTEECSNLLVNENLDIAYGIRLNIPQLVSALAISLEGLNLVNSVD